MHKLTGFSSRLLQLQLAGFAWIALIPTSKLTSGFPKALPENKTKKQAECPHIMPYPKEGISFIWICRALSHLQAILEDWGQEAQRTAWGFLPLPLTSTLLLGNRLLSLSLPHPCLSLSLSVGPRQNILKYFYSFWRIS